MILVKDQLGRVIKKIGLPPSSENSISQLNLSGLSVGTYYLHIISSGEVVVKTVQIQR